MKINKKKCNAWIDLMLSLTKMTRELNKDEMKYIYGCFSIALGELELKELKEKNAKYC